LSDNVEISSFQKPMFVQDGFMGAWATAKRLWSELKGKALK
jgi:hypothetical protein